LKGEKRFLLIKARTQNKVITQKFQKKKTKNVKPGN